MPGAIFPEGPAFFRGTFHARGHFPGRFCNFPGDLPCQCPFSRKVLQFSGGPSMPGAIFPEGPAFFGGPSMLEAVFPEGPAFFRGTFHARGHFSGRSCVFPGDLPRQRPFSWKVLVFSVGPSMPDPVFLEGPCPSALSLRYFGTPGAVRSLIQEMQRRSRSA